MYNPTWLAGKSLLNPINGGFNGNKSDIYIYTHQYNSIYQYIYITIYTLYTYVQTHTHIYIVEIYRPLSPHYM